MYGHRCVNAYLYSRYHKKKPKTWHSLTAVKLQTQYMLYSCQMPPKHNPLNMFFLQTLTHEQTQILPHIKNTIISAQYLHFVSINSSTHAYLSSPTQWTQSEERYSTLPVFFFSLQSPHSGVPAVALIAVHLSDFNSLAPTLSILPLFLSKAVGHTKVCEACSDGGCYRHWLVVL